VKDLKCVVCGRNVTVEDSFACDQVVAFECLLTGERVIVERHPRRVCVECSSAADPPGTDPAPGLEMALFNPQPYESCRRCGKPPLAHTTGEVAGLLSIDACLGGELPDVAEACCGHGDVEHAYVVVAPGCQPWTFTKDLTVPNTTLRGKDAIDYFASLGVGPAVFTEDSADA
jgi:hypothetical protein